MASTDPAIEPTQKVRVESLPRAARTHYLVLLLVWMISVVYMGTHLKRGWVPHDEGTLGMSAERILNGELPHHDFDDYTGGLTFVHALVFREIGINSASMRIVLFIFFVAWVPAVYYVASRFGPPYAAGAITLLAVAWSVPNYPGPMPSWYNLFFATFGVAALLRYLEVTSPSWLLFAGVCGGLSALAKITAAYFIAGVLLFFVFREQGVTKDKDQGSKTHAHVYSAVLALTLIAFVVSLFAMIHKIPAISELVYFVVPPCLLVTLLLSREFGGIVGTNRDRFATLLGMCVPFGLGILLPTTAFLVYYIRSGAAYDLLRGLMATPERAIGFAALPPIGLSMMATIDPFAVPLLLSYERGKLGRTICGSVIAIFSTGVLVFSGHNQFAYYFAWYSLATVIPALVLAGVAILWVSRVRERLTPLRQQQVMLLMCLAALCSLIQFPFSHPVYFFYVAPLVILFAASLFSSTVHPPRFALGALVSFYILFALLRVTPGFVHHMGYEYAPDAQTESMSIPRAGGIRTEPEVARLYDELIPLVQSHAKGEFIYAAPDCPELYFLSGFRSPTRYYFDFADDPVGHTQRTLRALDDLRVNVVAINKYPQFSGAMSPDLENALEQHFPHYADLAQFQVRWKE